MSPSELFQLEVILQINMISHLHHNYKFPSMRICVSSTPTKPICDLQYTYSESTIVAVQVSETYCLEFGTVFHLYCLSTMARDSNLLVHLTHRWEEKGCIQTFPMGICAKLNATFTREFDPRSNRILAFRLGMFLISHGIQPDSKMVQIYLATVSNSKVENTNNFILKHCNLISVLLS